jgi:DNA-binding NarL/FixJ family response regulator
MRPFLLIVEDHDALRASLREWIQAVFPWCTVLEARSGEEALGTSRQSPPVVVLMDIGLPGINGIETTRRLTGSVPGARVVMLTILDSDGYRRTATEAGACAFVAKSQMHTELLPLLGALLEPWCAEQASTSV